MIIYYIDNMARFYFFEKIIDDVNNSSFICEDLSVYRALSRRGYKINLISNLKIEELHPKTLIFFWNGTHKYQQKYQNLFKSYGLRCIFIENSNINNLFFFDEDGSNYRISYAVYSEFMEIIKTDGFICSSRFVDNIKYLEVANDQYTGGKNVIGREDYKRTIIEFILDVFTKKGTLINFYFSRIAPFMYRLSSLNLMKKASTTPIENAILFIEQEKYDTSYELDRDLIKKLVKLGENNHVNIRPHPSSKFPFWTSRYFKSWSGLDVQSSIEKQACAHKKIYTINSTAGVKLALSGFNVCFLSFSPFMTTEEKLREHLLTLPQIRDEIIRLIQK